MADDRGGCGAVYCGAIGCPALILEMRFPAAAGELCRLDAVAELQDQWGWVGVRPAIDGHKHEKPVHEASRQLRCVHLKCTDCSLLRLATEAVFYTCRKQSKRHQI